jgi:predicted secreted protein
MWRKILYTTVIATAIFGALYVAYTRDLIPFGFLERVSQPPHS